VGFLGSNLKHVGGVGFLGGLSSWDCRRSGISVIWAEYCEVNLRYEGVYSYSDDKYYASAVSNIISMILSI
jgi:hypothetical protein